MKRGIIAAGVGILLLAGCQNISSGTPQRGENWLKNARFGVFLHYLAGGPDFQKKIDSFDARKFADQISKTGADYVIFTLGQDSGYLCTPNATYNHYTGYAPGERCSTRDLPMEIADELSRRGIRLMLYSTCRSPNGDEKAMTGLADVPAKRPAPQEFVKRWSEVITEWSNRYGRKVSGWWIDGVYRPKDFETDRAYNWNTWSAAYRAGNPDTIIAYNNGANIEDAFLRLTGQQDYTAGEQNRFGAMPKYYPPYPQMQWHILSFLGNWWASPTGPNYDNDWLIDYVKKVNQQGGIVSIDVNIAWDGTIYPPHLKQLIALGKGLGRIKQ